MTELLTTKQVQDTLKVDRTTIYRMLKDGRLNGVKIGCQWRFLSSEINALLHGTASASESLPIQVNIAAHTEPSPAACLQAVQDVSAETVGVGAIIADNDGLPITTMSNACQFCTLIRSTPSGRQACINSFCNLSHQPHINPKFTTCHAGLHHARARIEVNNVTTSIFIVGQFYTTMPETAVQQQYIKRLAKKHKLNVNALTDAIQNVPIIPPTKQKNLMTWLEKLAGTFSVIGQERAEMIERFQRIIHISDFENSPLTS